MAEQALQADGIRALLDIGSASAGMVVTEHSGIPVIVVPERYAVKELPQPKARVDRAVSFQDVESFALYVNRFKTGGTLLFAVVNDTSCRITAHLDYNATPYLEGSPRPLGWSSHTAELVCVQTKEWKTWMENNARSKNPFGQLAFAQFIEENDRLFESPGAAELLEMVLTLEGKSNVRINQAQRLENGRLRVDFEDDVALTGATKSGQMDFPTEFLCKIIPFENGPQPYTVRSRLRWRVSNREISFWYDTVTPHLILKDAAKAVMDAVREKVPAPLLIGG